MNSLATEGETLKYLKYLEAINVLFQVATVSGDRNITLKLNAIELHAYVQHPSAFVAQYLAKRWHESSWNEVISANHVRGQCNARVSDLHRRCHNVRAVNSKFCTVRQHADLGKTIEQIVQAYHDEPKR